MGVAWLTHTHTHIHVCAHIFKAEGGGAEAALKCQDAALIDLIHFRRTHKFTSLIEILI